MKFLRILKTELYRGMISWKFSGIIFLIGILIPLSSIEEIQLVLQHHENVSQQSVLNLFITFMRFDRYKPLIILLLAAIYGGSFCEDWSNRYIRFLISRSSLKLYAIGKLTANFIAVMIATILSVLLGSAMLLPFFPLTNESLFDAQSLELFYPYEGVVQGKLPILYIVIIGVILGISAVLLSTFGILISAWVPNRFVAIGITFPLYYTLFAITFFFPHLFSFWALSLGIEILPGAGAFMNFIINLTMFFLPTLLLGLEFYSVLKTRYDNGKV